MAGLGTRFWDVALLVLAAAASACAPTPRVSTPTNSSASLPLCDASKLEAEVAELKVRQPWLGLPKKLQDRVPEYPREAKARNVQGEVAIRYRIQTDGTVDDLSILCAPDPTLAQASVDALLEWEFEPPYWNGTPKTMDSIARFTFR